MLLHVLSALACLVAGLIHFAVLRSPDVADTNVTRTARKIMIIAMLCCGTYILHAIYVHKTPSPLYLLLGLMALSQVLFGLNSLLPHLEKGHPKWSSHSNSLR